jgi:hypothetical protein
MARHFLHLALLLNCLTIAVAQDIPAQLQGKWIIKRVLPTSTISCWSYKEARRLVGTEIEYTSDTLRWKDRVASHPLVAVSVVSAEQFHRENSGGGAADSQVTLGQLGIQMANATQVVLTHPDIKPIWSAYEIPGDKVLIKDETTIIFQVCNVYLEARREVPRSGPKVISR